MCIRYIHIFRVVAVIFGSLGLVAARDADANEEDTGRMIRLHNGNFIPLVGFGVGNLQHELIEQVIVSNVKSDKKVHLIDTARASRNEHIIANSIAKLELGKGNQLRGRQMGKDADVIQIVTKVWYTHLGYERTRLSVAESLKDLSASASNIVVHVLLHWPRCDDSIPWMNCEEEENSLPQYVKDAGPSPHLDKDNAWKESWRALEDIYTEHTGAIHGKLPAVGSIGISNFKLQDMQTLVNSCRIKPSIYQGNLWVVLHEPHLMNLLRENGIVFQAYSLMSGAIQRQSFAPNAFSVLSGIGKDISLRIQKEHAGEQVLVTEAMVAIAWLVQNDIAVIPRASSSSHQQENSVIFIESMPELTEKESIKIKEAITALMRGDDLVLQTTFRNALPAGPVKVNWANTATGEEIEVIEQIHPGDSTTINAHPGHTFVVYDETNSRKEFVVSASYGEREKFSIDEF